MTSITQTHDEGFDDELSQLEQSLDRGQPWKYPTKPGEEMDPGMPNPLVIRVTGLSTGIVKGEELTFLTGVDARGKKWSRIVGSKSLRDTLLAGITSEWSDERQAFVEIGRVGQVKSGERVALTFKGFSTIATGAHAGKEIPNVKAVRVDIERPQEGAGTDADIPF